MPAESIDCAHKLPLGSSMGSSCNNCSPYRIFTFLFFRLVEISTLDCKKIYEFSAVKV